LRRGSLFGLILSLLGRVLPSLLQQQRFLVLLEVGKARADNVGAADGPDLGVQGQSLRPDQIRELRVADLRRDGGRMTDQRMTDQRMTDQRSPSFE